MIGFFLKKCPFLSSVGRLVLCVVNEVKKRRIFYFSTVKKTDEGEWKAAKSMGIFWKKIVYFVRIELPILKKVMIKEKTGVCIVV